MKMLAPKDTISLCLRGIEIPVVDGVAEVPLTLVDEVLCFGFTFAPPEVPVAEVPKAHHGKK